MTDPRRKDKQIAESRRVIVADCHKRGFTIRQTCEVVMKKLGMDKLPSTKTIFKDREFLMKEWREERISDTDDMVQLELQRIDDALIQLWEAWEKSKTDFKAKFSKRKGELSSKGKGATSDQPENDSSDKIKTTHLEQGEKEEINFGDPRYISEIRFQLIERRKLLGLYAPEKSEITGKNGKDLMPEKEIDLSALSAEDKATLLEIARKVERTE